MPKMQAKLSKKLASNTISGFTMNNIIPANESADKLSYYLNTSGARRAKIVIIDARTTDTEKLHKNAYANKKTATKISLTDGLVLKRLKIAFKIATIIPTCRPDTASK